MKMRIFLIDSSLWLEIQRQRALESQQDIYNDTDISQLFGETMASFQSYETPHQLAERDRINGHLPEGPVDQEFEENNWFHVIHHNNDVYRTYEFTSDNSDVEMDIRRPPRNHQFSEDSPEYHTARQDYDMDYSSDSDVTFDLDSEDEDFTYPSESQISSEN